MSDDTQPLLLKEPRSEQICGPRCVACCYNQFQCQGASMLPAAFDQVPCQMVRRKPNLRLPLLLGEEHSNVDVTELLKSRKAVRQNYFPRIL